MRIAIVTEVFLPAVDGVVTRLRRTLDELERLGDDVLVVAPAGGPPRYAGAAVMGMRALRLPLYPDGDGYPEKRIALPGPSLGRALRRFAPDVIHAVNPVLLSAGAVYHARRLAIPLVASYHANLAVYSRYYGLGLLEGPGWRYVRAVHERADVNLCTSVATLQTLAARGFPRLELWPYGVDARPSDGAADARSWRTRLSGGAPERTILLFVGRLAKEKDVDALLPAVRDVPDVALALVGDGPLRARLERAFAGTRTTFTGMLTGRDLAAAYASADVFVFPSQTETLGLVLLEARAAALPVVAADSAAARALVRHGRDGMLFDPGDPVSLTRAVTVLAQDRGRRTGMGLEARRSTGEATWAEATRALRGHYEAARAAPPPRGAADAWGAARDGAPPGRGPDPAPRSIR